MFEKSKNEIPKPIESKASPEDFQNFEKNLGPKLLELSRLIGKKSKEATQKILRVVFNKVLPVYAIYLGLAYVSQKPDGKFSEKDRARMEMEKNGITSEQKSTYKLGMSDLIYRGITPWGYDIEGEIMNLIPNLVQGRESMDEFSPQENPAREDAWKLYLGLPQTHNTFGISDYKPEKSKEDKFYLKINDFHLAFMHYLFTEDIINPDKVSFPHSVKDRIEEEFLEYVRRLKLKGGTTVVNFEVPIPDNNLEKDKRDKRTSSWHLDTINLHESDVMGLYTVSCGEDDKGSYISYYDKWDLAVPTETSGKGFGRALEIYDRIYYNPDTGEIIESLLSK